MPEIKEYKMKKFISVLVLAALCLSSCGAKNFADSTTCADLMNAALATQADAPQYENLYTDAESNLDEYTLSILADSTYEECAEYALLDGYAMYLCGGRQTFEIDVLKAKDEAGVQSLQALLERRMKTLSAGDKAMYDPDFQSMMDNAKLYTDGLFVILLITYDNSAAQSAVDGLKQ